MKNISLLVVFLMVQTLTQTAFGQGNLQFNQTRLINFTTPNISVPPNTSVIFYDSTTFVVPTGKTLKIENIYSSLIQNGVQLGPNLFVDNFPSDASSLRVFIDDVLVHYGTTNDNNEVPLWLPAGTYKLKIYYNFTSNFTSYKIKVLISALEFNIIP